MNWWVSWIFATTYLAIGVLLGWVFFGKGRWTRA